MSTDTTAAKPSKGKSVALWLAAFAIMMFAASWQRQTGPTYDYDGTATTVNGTYEYTLTRSAETTANTKVAIPGALVGELEATLHFKRYPTQEPYQGVSMTVEDDEVIGHLPRQPAAGKLAYFIELTGSGSAARLPEIDDFPVIIRYKDPVSPFILVPHILLMFVGMMFGVRTALGALFMPNTMRRWTFWTLGLIGVGGLILGPMVQNAAFGAYWTGWPFGGDLTDNKTLIMWLGWLAAAILLRKPAFDLKKRLLVVLAAVIMIGVYLVPHSLRGSELDYESLDSGIDATEAVETGR